MTFCFHIYLDLQQKYIHSRTKFIFRRSKITLYDITILVVALSAVGNSKSPKYNTNKNVCSLLSLPVIASSHAIHTQLTNLSQLAISMIVENRCEPAKKRQRSFRESSLMMKQFDCNRVSMQPCFSTLNSAFLHQIPPLFG